MRLTRLWAAALAATVLFGPAPAAGAATPTRYEPVRQALEQMVAGGEPGAWARIDDHGLQWTAGSGVADTGTGARIRPDDEFRIASDTKSMVAVVVLQLVAERRLRLDQPIGDFLPGAVEKADRITVRQLLDHTSGLATYDRHPEFADPAGYRWKTYRPEQLVGFGNALGAVDQPGHAFHYSNTNYVLLGMLIEKITGHPAGAELAARVFRPAGMAHSQLPTTFPLITGPHPTGYYRTGGEHPVNAPITELNPSFAWTAYGVVSNAEDLQRFYRALFGGRLLPPELLAQMRTAVPTGQPAYFTGYGLGLEGLALSCGTFWGHTGSIPGYENLSYASADGSRQITIAMNVFRTDPAVGTVLLQAIKTIDGYLCG